MVLGVREKKSFQKMGEMTMISRIYTVKRTRNFVNVVFTIGQDELAGRKALLEQIVGTLRFKT